MLSGIEISQFFVSDHLNDVICCGNNPAVRKTQADVFEKEPSYKKLIRLIFSMVIFRCTDTFAARLQS